MRARGKKISELAGGQCTMEPLRFCAKKIQDLG
jgi:hypothetical protein